MRTFKECEGTQPMGLDEMHLWILRAKPVPIVFEKSWQYNEVLTHWKEGNISTIFEKGIKEDLFLFLFLSLPLYLTFTVK